jgi:hypothetical protein
VLATLPPRQREVIVARDIDGQRPGEIAASLGLTLSAVDSLLLRARRRVAVAWRAGRPEGGLVTTHVASASLAATTAAASVTDPASLRFLSRLGDAIARATYRVAGGVGVLPGPTTLAQRLGGVAAAGVIVAAPLAAALPSPAASVTAAPAVHRSAPIIDIVASALHQATTVRLPHAQPVPLTVTMPTIKAPPVQLPSGALPSAPSGHLPPVALPSAGSVDANQVTSGLATATNGLQTTISGVTATVSGVTSTLTRPGVAPPFASAVVGGATTVVRGATHTVTGVAGTLGIAR